MLNFTMLPKKLNISIFFFGILIYSFASSASLEEKKKALDIIADHAERMCIKVQMHGENKKYYAEGGANIDARGLLKKLVSAGVHVNSRVDYEKYDGFLQKDLFDAALERNRCAQKYSDKLIEWIIDDEPIIVKSEMRLNYSYAEIILPDGRTCINIVENGQSSQKCTTSKK